MRIRMTVIIAGCLVALSAFSQNKIRYKPVSVLLSIGRGTQHAEGVIGSIEPAAQIGNNRIGFRFEGVSTDMKAIGSSMLTYERYFFDNDFFRLSAGGGIGKANSQEQGGCSPGPGTVSEVREMKPMAGMLRLGITISHFRLGAEYNMLSPTVVSAVNVEGKATGIHNYENSYFGFKFGFVIGGGRKEDKARE